MGKLIKNYRLLINRINDRSKLNTLAWILFLACGIVYTVAAIRDRDLLMITGSICFVVAVIIFLLPDKKQ